VAVEEGMAAEVAVEEEAAEEANFKMHGYCYSINPVLYLPKLNRVEKYYLIICRPFLYKHKLCAGNHNTQTPANRFGNGKDLGIKER
jgi:hypothetical protein